jgi:hypothetical protein
MPGFLVSCRVALPAFRDGLVPVLFDDMAGPSREKWGDGVAAQGIERR